MRIKFRWMMLLGIAALYQPQTLLAEFDGGEIPQFFQDQSPFLLFQLLFGIFSALLEALFGGILGSTV